MEVAGVVEVEATTVVQISYDVIDSLIKFILRLLSFKRRFAQHPRNLLPLPLSFSHFQHGKGRRDVGVSVTSHAITGFRKPEPE